ncbi:MAG: hypothetical protein ABH870_06640, partial [bacterium]
MKQGDVILTPVPQTDGRLKNRPAVILREMPSYGDLLVCGIRGEAMQRSPYFGLTNLKKILDILFVLCYTFIIMKHQPSAISHQPSAISHQPSAISHQPSAISHQPSAISHQPSAIGD